MVDETTTAAEQISIATGQQRSASDQVVVAMTQVSEVSQQTAAGAESSVAAAARLDGLSGRLEESIARFQLVSKP
jgi:methyl-accepting chemotaxis protein